MPTKKTTKSSAKKPQVKMSDLKPKKDAKGGRTNKAGNLGSPSHRYNVN